MHSERSIFCFKFSAPFAAIEYGIPILCPLFAPDKGTLAGLADFGGQI